MIYSVVGETAKKILEELNIPVTTTGEYREESSECVVEFRHDKARGLDIIEAFGTGVGVTIAADVMGNLKIVETDLRADARKQAAPLGGNGIQRTTFVEPFGGVSILTHAFDKISGCTIGDAKMVVPEPSAPVARAIGDRVRRVYKLFEA